MEIAFMFAGGGLILLGVCFLAYRLVLARQVLRRMRQGVEGLTKNQRATLTQRWSEQHGEGSPERHMARVVRGQNAQAIVVSITAIAVGVCLIVGISLLR